MNPVVSLFARFSSSSRSVRDSVFRESFPLGEDTKVLDLGSEDGSHIANVLNGTAVRPENVFIADIDSALIERGRERFGFVPVLIEQSGRISFEDGFFDVVYCSSVLEHVTIPKDEVWSTRSGREFKSRSWVRQTQFAEEILRVGKAFFVQTPYRYFPVESHSWLPLVALLPRELLVPVLRFADTFWVKKTTPDWNLLNKRQMAALFPGSEIVAERWHGLTKSIMAIGRGVAAD